MLPTVISAKPTILAGTIIAARIPPDIEEVTPLMVSEICFYVYVSIVVTMVEGDGGLAGGVTVGVGV
jgi:hypothetical protein